MDIIPGILIFLVAAAIYLAPIAVGWNHPHIGPIAIITLLLGWTVIGWIVALVWALVPAEQKTNLPPPGWYPNPDDPPTVVRWWDGTQWTDRAWQQQTQ